MKESWKLSNERLSDWVMYLKKNPRDLIEDLEYVIYLMDGSVYPKNTHHLVLAQSMHVKAIDIISDLLDNDEGYILHHDIYSDIFPWTITRETLENIIFSLKEDNLDFVKDFFASLNYLKYIQAHDAGFIKLDKNILNNMLKMHKELDKHLDKAIETRRLRVLL